jgi:RNA polymerase sigma-70 factor (sigma-E family)
VRTEGDAVTFEAFVEQQGSALLRLAFVLTGNHHEAEDLAQTALAEVYRHWRKVSAARSPEAYARRVLVNGFLSHRRRRWTGERPVEVADRDLPPVADHASAVVEREVLRARVAELPPRARTVVVLRFWADLDDDAIAEAMGTTPSTVRVTASRALAALRSDGTADLEEAR